MKSSPEMGLFKGRIVETKAEKSHLASKDQMAKAYGIENDCGIVQMSQEYISVGSKTSTNAGNPEYGGM